MDVSKHNTHFSHKVKSHLLYLLMHFFEKKMGMKTFLVDVWLEGGREEKFVRSRCFLSGPTKMFSLQNKKQMKWEKFDR